MLRVFTKDLIELLGGLRGVVLVLILPPLLVLLVGQLKTQPSPFRLLVAGAPSETLAERTSDEVEQARRLILLLRELTLLEVTARKGRLEDPLAKMQEQRFDLVLDLGCDEDSGCPSSKQWRLYTAETDPVRFSTLKLLVTGLERELKLEEKPGEKPGETLPPAGDFEKFFHHAMRLAGTRPASLFVYYPLVDEPRLFLLPMTIALIVSFLPFALAVSTLIREREGHTLEILLTIPRLGPANIFLGKAILPVAVTVVDFLIMLIVAQSLYGLQVKAGMIAIGLFLLPAMLTSTMVGLLVSAFASSQPQALLASAIYFLALTLVTGFLLPLGEASPVIVGISHLLPMTFVLPTIRGWMFGVQPLTGYEEGLVWLGGQFILYGALAGLAFRSMLRRV